MAVRKQCNRYKERPHGADFHDVLKRAKRFYSFEGIHDTFEMIPLGGSWYAEPKHLPPFTVPNGTLVVKWSTENKKWIVE